MPEISVIINCHNGEKYLKETLESVNNQTYQNYEIIFWDNASTDKSAAIAKGCAYNLRYFYSKEFTSLGKARNNAIAQCNGEYIAFLDSDDLWENHKLQRQIQVMEQNPDIGLVMTNFRTFNMFKNEISETKAEKDRSYSFEQFIKEYAYCLSTFIIRKKYVDEMKLWFDERFEYAEEYDFFSRLAYKCKVYYLGEPLAIRRMHGEMSTIRLAERIPAEHQMALDNLRAYIPGFDQDYPSVVRKIEYIRDYMHAKYLFPKKDNRKIRGLVKPYVFTEKRALAYFLIACLPKRLSVWIYKKIYHNSI